MTWPAALVSLGLTASCTTTPDEVTAVLPLCVLACWVSEALAVTNAPLASTAFTGAVASSRAVEALTE